MPRSLAARTVAATQRRAAAARGDAAVKYIGSWVLPSGNSCDVYLAWELTPGTVTLDALECRWDRAPSPSRPTADVDHWRAVTFPEILRAVAVATGQRVLGVSL